MKKTLFLTTAIFLLLALLPVSADYIVVPSDEFRMNHDCTNHDQYYTNSELLDIYVSPEYTDPYHQAPAGSYFHIQYLYTDENNVVWGNQGQEVWMKMNELTLVNSNSEILDNIEIYNPHKESRQSSILSLVIGACVLTGGLYVLLHKKK